MLPFKRDRVDFVRENREREGGREGEEERETERERE
jgi:hypothetical protein